MAAGGMWVWGSMESLVDRSPTPPGPASPADASCSEEEPGWRESGDEGGAEASAAFSSGECGMHGSGVPALRQQGDCSSNLHHHHHHHLSTTSASSGSSSNGESYPPSSPLDPLLSSQFDVAALMQQMGQGLKQLFFS